MHEFSIAEALAARVLTHAPEKGRVRVVEIRVGALRGLETESLTMCWQAVTGGTVLDGSTLEVEQLPWQIDCATCGRSWTSRVPFVTCACGNEAPIPTAGDELNLIAISVDEDAGAGDGAAAAPGAGASRAATPETQKAEAHS